MSDRTSSGKHRASKYEGRREKQRLRRALEYQEDAHCVDARLYVRDGEIYTICPHCEPRLVDRLA